MAANKSRDTQPEMLVRSALHSMGLRFRKHARPLAGLRCTADVVFPREKVAVFIDGCFWHGCPEHGGVPRTNNAYWGEKLERNQLRDRRNKRVLSEAGWTVLRYWEHERPDEIANQVRDIVVERRRESSA